MGHSDKTGSSATQTLFSLTFSVILSALSQAVTMLTISKSNTTGCQKFIHLSPVSLLCLTSLQY